MTFDAIERLGRATEQAWAAEGHADAAFSRVAARCLAAPLDFDLESLRSGLFRGAQLPPQRRLDTAFGEPGVTLFAGERFTIEALCWHTGTPAIHHHGFSGAFRMITGSSVHSCYRFEPHTRAGSLIVGRLVLRQTDVIESGAVVEIPRGDALIHSTFHLERLNMTLVVRTQEISGGELTYLPPGVAYDSSMRTPALHKQLQLLDTLNRISHPGYVESVHAAIDRGEPYDSLVILLRAGGHAMADADTFAGFVERFVTHHGPSAQPMAAALWEARRRGMVARLRERVVDRESRFFLAVLMASATRRGLLLPMEQRYGRDAPAQIAEGVAGLLEGDAARRAVTAAAARALLEDVGADAFAGWLASFWQRALSDVEQTKVATFYSSLMHHPLLVPLRTVEAAVS